MQWREMTCWVRWRWLSAESPRQARATLFDCLIQMYARVFDLVLGGNVDADADFFGGSAFPEWEVVGGGEFGGHVGS